VFVGVEGVKDAFRERGVEGADMGVMVEEEGI